MSPFDYTRYQLHLAEAREQQLHLSWAGVVFDPSKHPRLAGKFTFSSSAGKFSSLPGHHFDADPTQPGHPLKGHGFSVRQEHEWDSAESKSKPKDTYKIVARKPGSQSGGVRVLAKGLKGDKLAEKLDKLSTPEGLPKDWRPAESSPTKDERGADPEKVAQRVESHPPGTEHPLDTGHKTGRNESGQYWITAPGKAPQLVGDREKYKKRLANLKPVKTGRAALTENSTDAEHLQHATAAQSQQLRRAIVGIKNVSSQAQLKQLNKQREQVRQAIRNNTGA